MGVFDNYYNGEQDPIIKNAELTNVPFYIEKMRYRENVSSEFGTKNQIITTVRIAETGEVFTYFAENSVVLSKLLYLITANIPYKDVKFKLFKTKSANTNEYWDISEVTEEPVEEFPGSSVPL